MHCTIWFNFYGCIMKYFLSAIAAIFIFSSSATAGTIVLTGHDPDFHADAGTAAQRQAAININNAFVDYILDPLFNPIVASGTSKFLFVESFISPPGGHRVGENGMIASGYNSGTDYEKHDASTLAVELGLLGTKYAGLVIASDFGGLLTQAELDILNANSSVIVDFLNVANGGVYAMAQSGNGAGLTTSGRYGFLPFVVSNVPANQSEAGTTVTAFGAGLGLTDQDVSLNFSHNVFADDFGLNVVDNDSQGRILSLAGRGTVDPGTGVNPVPLPSSMVLMGIAMAGFGVLRRKRA